MSVDASTVRQDEFLIEITTPSKTDNVLIKLSRAEGLCNTRACTSCWVRGALTVATEKVDPLLWHTMLSEDNDTIGQEHGTLHW